MLTINDINEEAIGRDEDGLVEKEYPKMVAGRVAHIDADFLAYMASYERKDEDMHLDEILYRTDVMIEDKRREAGAEKSVLHLTPNTSDKGGRYEVAIQKQYQGQRSSDDKPRYLEATRSYMADLRGTNYGIAWQNAEADDGMAEASYKALADGTPELVVIVTKDKDLRMCPALHLDWDTGEITETWKDPFGYVDLVAQVSAKTGKTTKKPKGFGTKWFWWQLLMGDAADNIKGCPKAVIGGKHKACGQVGAYELIKDAKSDRECLDIVKEAFKSNEYTHYLTGEPATWQDVMWSEAQMLWMQRTAGDINDVKKWVKEIIQNG